MNADTSEVALYFQWIYWKPITEKSFYHDNKNFEFAFYVISQEPKSPCIRVTKVKRRDQPRIQEGMLKIYSEPIEFGVKSQRNWLNRK